MFLHDFGNFDVEVQFRLPIYIFSFLKIYFSKSMKKEHKPDRNSLRILVRKMPKFVLLFWKMHVFYEAHIPKTIKNFKVFWCLMKFRCVSLFVGFRGFGAPIFFEVVFIFFSLTNFFGGQMKIIDVAILCIYRGFQRFGALLDIWVRRLCGTPLGPQVRLCDATNFDLFLWWFLFFVVWSNNRPTRFAAPLLPRRVSQLQPTIHSRPNFPHAGKIGNGPGRS